VERNNGSVLAAVKWVLAISCLLKLTVILFAGHLYMLDSDDTSYLATARIWLETGVFTYNDPDRPTVFITPALPAMVAALMKLFGSGYPLEQAIRIAQTLLMTYALYVWFRIGCRLMGERAALWGALLTAFYLPLWLVSNFILTEALFVLALTWLVYTALRAMGQPTWVASALFGLAWAFAVYVRPTIALWPGVAFALFWLWRIAPRRKLLALSGVAALVFCLCMSPWWIRNARIAEGAFIPLTASSGNPLLLGSFPGGMPSLEVQRTWHATGNLRENDAFDKKWAMERIRSGFKEKPLTYLAWYTLGKFSFFWGDAYYWRRIAGIPEVFVWLSHYAMLGLGAVGMWQARGRRNIRLLLSLCGYMTLLHMVYLAHGRYSVVLMPIVALFAGAAASRIKWGRRW